MTERTNALPTRQVVDPEPQLVVPTDVVQQLERAQVDIQVATAHAYPRQREVVLKAIVNEALQEPDKMLYVLKFKNAQTGREEIVEGPSIRLAEVIAQNWGNLRIAAHVTEVRPEYVRAEALAWDLQTNACVKEEVTQPTIDRSGKPLRERQRIIYQQVALSKAIRNAVLRIVPRSVVNVVIAAVKRTAQVDAKTIAKLKAWLDSIGVSEAAACRVIGAPSLNAMTPEQLNTLRGIYNAIKEGDMTPQEAFDLAEAPAQPEQEQEAKPEPEQAQTKTAPSQTPTPHAQPPKTEPSKAATQPQAAAQTAPQSEPQRDSKAALLQDFLSQLANAGVTETEYRTAFAMIGLPQDPAVWDEQRLRTMMYNMADTITEIKRLNAVAAKKRVTKQTQAKPDKVDPEPKVTTSEESQIDDLLV